jgi:hypothetical protein
MGALIVFGFAASPSIQASSAPNDGQVPAATAPSQWQEISGLTALRHGGMFTVIAGGAGFIAGGTTYDGKGGARATIWTSPDGTTWSRTLLPQPTSSGDVTSIAYNGHRYVAVGESSHPDTETSDAAIWTSTDARHWRAIAPLPSFRGASFFDVAAGSAGFVAVGAHWVGQDCTDTDELCVLAEPRVWSSRDGIHWTRQSTSFAGRRSLAHVELSGDDMLPLALPRMSSAAAA